MQHLPALGLAGIAALCIAVGAVLRQREAVRIPDAELGRFGAIGDLVHRPAWWLGTAVGAGGYLFQAMALNRGSVVLVQAVLVTSLLFALPLGARFAERTVRAVEWMWALVLMAAVVLVVVVGDPRSGREHAEGLHWLLIAVIGGPLLVACLLGARMWPGHRRALLLGVASGAVFGVAAVLTKGVVALIGEGPGRLLVSPEVYLLVVLGLTAIMLQQNAYQAGDLAASLPAGTITEPMVAAGLGFVVLGEYLDVDKRLSALLVGALAAMIAATIALARSTAQVEEGAVTR